MDQKIAVLFMPDNIACTEEKTPLMLQPILFCPVLTWMCAELCGRGIERLFIVSDVSAQERMKPYLPKGADVTSQKTPMLSTSTVPDTGKSF